MGERLSDFGNVAVLDPEVPSADSISIEIPDSPESLMPDTAPMIATAEKTEPKSDMPIEQVVAEVSEHFDGRIFTFKKYSGTAAQMIEQCPMAQMAAGRGKEFVISFLEKFDGMPEDPQPEPPKQESLKEIDEPRTEGESETNDGETEKSDTNFYESKAEKDTSITKVMIAQTAIVETKREASETVLDTESESVSENKEYDSSSNDTIGDIQGIRVDTTDSRTVPTLPEAVEAEVENIRRISEKSNPTPLPLLPLPVAEKTPSAEEIIAPIKARTIEVMDIIEQPYVKKEPVVMIDPELTKPADGTEIQIEDNRQIESKIIEEIVAAPLPVIATETLVKDEMASTIILEEIGETSQAIRVEVSNVDRETILAVEQIESIDSVGITDEETVSPEFRMDSEVAEVSGSADEMTIGDREDGSSDYQAVVEVAENSDSPIAEMHTQEIPEMTDRNPLTSIIVEKVEEQSEQERPAIKERLVEVVRSIEILKRAQSAEECADALAELRQNLTTLFEEQGYDNPERMAAELLQNYHLMTIDEAMNEALRVARTKHAHGFTMPKIHGLSLGRHVVSMLFVTVSNDILLRYVYSANSKA